MKIITLHPSEWRAYRKLRLNALREEPDAFGQRLEDAREIPQRIWRERLKRSSRAQAEWIFFAASGKKLLGMIRASRDRRPKRKHVAELFNLFVVPEARRQGVAEKLMSSVLSALSKDPTFSKVKLCVYSQQKAAIVLYKKLGFSLVGRLHKEIDTGKKIIDEIIMEKIL